ncbi:hypothetical protein Tco_0524891 [Tanacetum coccineum]
MDGVDGWLNAEITKHMSMLGVENMKDALISIINSIRQKMKDDIMKKQYEPSTASISDETSSIASNEVDKDDNNTSNTASYQLPKELSPRSFLLPFNIDNHSFYAITTLDAKDNIMPLKKIYMVDIGQEEETFNPLEIRIDLLSYESPACLEFEQRTRSYGTPNPQDEIADPICFSLDRRGLVKRWHICKPIHVTYDDGSGEDCGMWPTCDPDSKFCFGYNEVFRVNKQGSLRLIGHNNLHESDREFILNKWILDSYDIEEEYAREIGNPYSKRFDEYNKVFNNDIKHLSNEYILRIEKKGYVLDDVWEKCQQNYKKTNEAWHNEAYEEDEMWRSRDEKTDYDPPYVNVKTFELKKYSFKGGRSFICITDREDEALPLGHMNGA